MGPNMEQFTWRKTPCVVKNWVLPDVNIMMICTYPLTFEQVGLKLTSLTSWANTITI